MIVEERSDVEGEAEPNEAERGSNAAASTSSSDEHAVPGTLIMRGRGLFHKCEGANLTSLWNPAGVEKAAEDDAVRTTAAQPAVETTSTRLDQPGE